VVNFSYYVYSRMFCRIITKKSCVAKSLVSKVEQFLISLAAEELYN